MGFLNLDIPFVADTSAANSRAGVVKSGEVAGRMDPQFSIVSSQAPTLLPRSASHCVCFETSKVDTFSRERRSWDFAVVFLR